MVLRILVAALCFVCASRARADLLVVAPPFYEGTDGEKVSYQIAELVVAELSTQHTVVAPAQAAALVPSDDRVSCAEGDCAERYRESAGAVAAVVIRVGRAASGAGPATSFQIGIQPAPGIEYAQGAVISEGELRTLVVRAVREVLRQYRQGPGPWLEVTGAPKGAGVYIDDRATGTLPMTIALPSGTHRVRVEAEGFAPMTRIVSLSAPGDRQRLVLRLEAVRPSHVRHSVEHSEGKGTPAGHAQPSLAHDPWLYAGAVSAVGGAVAMGLGVHAWSRDGSCASVDEGVCEDRYDAPSPAVAASIGAAALVAGGGVIAWRLFKSRAALSVSRDHVGVSFQGSL